MIEKRINRSARRLKHGRNFHHMDVYKAKLVFNIMNSPYDLSIHYIRKISEEDFVFKISDGLF